MTLMFNQVNTFTGIMSLKVESLRISPLAETELDGQILEARQKIKQQKGKVEHLVPLSISNER